MKAITFLGIKPTETCYVFPNGQEHTAPFFGLALAQFIPNLIIRVFVTTATSQLYEKEFRPAVQCQGVEPIHIPDGRDDAELWEIFQRVVNSIDEGEEVIFDITHGFRSLPFLSFLAAAYLRKAKKIQLKHVFFGNFAARDQSVTPNRTPVLDLTNFVELLDWMVGADLFVRFGDARDLANLLRAQHKRVKPDPKTASKDEMSAWNNSPIKTTADNLTTVSQALRVVRPAEVMKVSRQICQQLPEAISSVGSLAKPFQPLAQQVVDSFQKIACGDHELEAERELIGWYLERDQIFQAVALMREWLVSWVMVQLGMSDQQLLEKEARANVEKVLGKAIREVRGADPEKGEEHTDDLSKLQTPVRKKVVNLYNQIGDLRNDLMHAGKRKESKSAKIVEQQAKKLYEEIKKLPLEQ
ncbi:TIGR02221 family CRISPR-associated protein [uncultured Chloroflexus sp.]|uniref:TIGR02221 family CRISPR-associated protein n=1 Tax=uncultured Chloroflexus sp. TaxID=214040 RepID=UPI00260E0440|nr:TIGR02221 family CRISPR-associated protein [uncultured Chloroflexus sp.]